MNLAGQHTPVLIVGAGPSGLMMAAQLLRNGVQPVIIDARQGPTTQSKALAVQARSLEIYRQLGLADTVVDNGAQASALIYHQNGNAMATLPLANIGREQTPFPYVLVYQQYKNERVLLNYLTQNCCPVYWDTRFISAKQTAGKVEVVLEQNGHELSLSCDWLIGADGAHSSVRRQFNIPFTGDTYPNLFYLADVTLAQGEGLTLNFYLSDKGFVGFFPMPEPNRYRVIGNLPQKLSEVEGLTLDEVLPWIQSITSAKHHFTECHWFTTYKLHHRMAERFTNGTCFLIGDAAHIHSPVGGQGMNTGLQDAYNLGWKLAAVVNGQITPSILNTYAVERMPVAQTLLKTTDRIFNLAMANNIVAKAFKKYLLARMLRFLWGNDRTKEALFVRLSQIGLNYRDSRLSLHLSRSVKIKAGDRLPYLKIFDEKKRTETDLHAWCSQPGFTFIALGKVAEMDLFSLAKWITQTYPHMLNFFYLPLSAKNQQVFNAFEVDGNQLKTLIIRPDMHIGLINDGIDMEIIKNYMENVVGIVSKP